MTAKVYDFPTGTKRHLGPWLGPLSTTVRLLGVHQEKVPDRENVVTQHPRFVVEIVSVGSAKFQFALEVDGVDALHATLDLVVDAAHQRGRGMTVTDYTDGVAQLPESCKPENQDL